MQPPLPPGRRTPTRAPLPTMALVVGSTYCSIALVLAMAPAMSLQLAHDALVMRALGLTLAAAALMLARVAVVASAGVRRAAALIVASPTLALGALLLAWPQVAALLYDRGMSALAPWLIGVPGILALALSRWRLS